MEKYRRGLEVRREREKGFGGREGGGRGRKKMIQQNSNLYTLAPPF